MFKKIFSLVLLIFVTGSNFAQFGSMPPFTVDIEPVSGTTLPGLHSYAFAQSGDKWLIIGGRTNGLHGVNSSSGFPAEYKNDAVIVIDTLTWNYYSADLNQLPRAVADPMRSTNMQYIQEGNYLYMVGGYGYDSVASIFVTFPKMTAVHVDNMINAVINAQPIALHIRQVTDTNFAVCGGELGKIGSQLYLVFGHNFGGRYTDPPTPLFTQTYSDRIKKFSFTDDGTTINLSAFTYDVDTNNYHRRDGNSGPVVKPDGSLAIGAYGGVFRKDSVLPFREPITISAGGTTVNMSYQQVMSHYTCALMPIYDSVSQIMYTTFFGGISLYDYNDTTMTIKRDSLVPFIDDITTMAVHPGGFTEETILAEEMPTLLGANAKFIHTGHLSYYPNEVIRIRALPNTRILAGYMLGGIRAEQGNFGTSYANDIVYRIYITPNNYTSLEEQSSLKNVQLFPNPASTNTLLLFSLKQTEKVRVSLNDITGKEIALLADEQMQEGNNRVNINTSKLSPGIYLCRIQSEQAEKLVKLVVGR